jgi:hypothetical protein
MEEEKNYPPMDEGVAEEPPKKSKRDQLRERISSKYPDKTFDSDDAYADQLYDDIEANDKELNALKTDRKSLDDFLGNDPRSASFLVDWHEGKDPVIALIKNYGTEIVDAVDDPERQEEMARANREYLEKVNQNKKFEEEYKTNIQQSLDDLAKAKEENGWSDEETDAALDIMCHIADDLIMGKFTPETVQLMMNAQNFDQAVAEAQQEGEVKGRNSKIEEKLRKSQTSDGTPHLEGANGGQNKKNLATQSIFDLASQA